MARYSGERYCKKEKLGYVLLLLLFVNEKRVSVWYMARFLIKKKSLYEELRVKRGKKLSNEAKT